MFSNFLASNLWLKAFICFGFSYLVGFISIKKYVNFAANNPKFFQPIRKEGPETHLETKKKTPTMGGIFIVLATLLSSILFVDISNRYILVACTIFLTFGLIGFVDDYLKVFYRNTKGFRGSYKLIIQFSVIGLAFLWLGVIDEIHIQNRIFLPFGDGYYLVLHAIFYVLFVNLVIVGTSNAVNLTDGLDGLVSVPAIINLCCLILLIYAASNLDSALKFQVPYVKFSGELIFFCISLIGAILAFLTFNLKPAKIFMGDVGSLSIGSVLGLIAIIAKQEFIFFIVSLLFVIEAVSVILQVGSYKLRKKRIFLMAPIHHHFEKLGWSEIKVVRSFWASSFIFACLGLLIFMA